MIKMYVYFYYNMINMYVYIYINMIKMYIYVIGRKALCVLI